MSISETLKSGRIAGKIAILLLGGEEMLQVYSIQTVLDSTLELRFSVPYMFI